MQSKASKRIATAAAVAIAIPIVISSAIAISMSGSISMDIAIAVAGASAIAIAIAIAIAFYSKRRARRLYRVLSQAGSSLLKRAVQCVSRSILIRIISSDCDLLTRL